MLQVVLDYTKFVNDAHPFMQKQKKRIDALETELKKAQSVASNLSTQIGKKNLALEQLRVKCSGLANDKKARDDSIKLLKDQAKEKDTTKEEAILEKKAVLQVNVAKEKAFIKIDAKDKEFNRKMD